MKVTIVGCPASPYASYDRGRGHIFINGMYVGTDGGMSAGTRLQVEIPSFPVYLTWWPDYGGVSSDLSIHENPHLIHEIIEKKDLDADGVYVFGRSPFGTDNCWPETYPTDKLGVQRADVTGVPGITRVPSLSGALGWYWPYPTPTRAPAPKWPFAVIVATALAAGGGVWALQRGK